MMDLLFTRLCVVHFQRVRLLSLSQNRYNMGVCASTGVDASLLSHIHSFEMALDSPELATDEAAQAHCLDALRHAKNLVRDVSDGHVEASEEALEQVAEVLFGRAVTTSEKECSGIMNSIDATTKALKTAFGSADIPFDAHCVSSKVQAFFANQKSGR